MKTRYLTLDALLLAILIICSQLVIPIPPVPITLQTLAVLLIGFILPPLHAILVTSLYAVIGLVGLPVFAGWSGGPNSFMSPAFGFVIGFIFASGAVAYYLNLVSTRSMKHLIIAGCFATIIIYGIGLPYFSYIFAAVLKQPVTMSKALSLAFIPFIPGDLIKLTIAILIANQLQTRITNYR